MATHLTTMVEELRAALDSAEWATSDPEAHAFVADGLAEIKVVLLEKEEGC